MLSLLSIFSGFFFSFSSRRRHTRCSRDWSSDVCSSDLEAETKRGIIRAPVRAHDVAESVELLGLPVGGETHHFVFVAEFQEAEILCQRRVIQPERMRKRHGALNFHPRPCTCPPHRAGEI